MVYDQESMKDGFAFGLDSSTQTGLCFAIQPPCRNTLRPRKRTPAKGHVCFTLESGHVRGNVEIRVAASSQNVYLLFEDASSAL